jgi:hypothetical protein
VVIPSIKKIQLNAVDPAAESCNSTRLLVDYRKNPSNFLAWPYTIVNGPASEDSHMIHRGLKCFTRLAIFSILAAGIALAIGCVTSDHADSGNKNASIPVTGDLPSGGRLIEIDSYDFADKYLEKDLETILPKLGLSPLTQISNREDFKFRIWTDLGGLVDPRLLGVDFNGRENEAYFFKMDRGAYAKSRKQVLTSPRSGWNQMILELKSRLTTPKGLIRDPQFSLERDEPLIALEVVDREEYSRVLYGKHTQFRDGKRLIEVCEYLAFEFDIDMSCRSERTSSNP